MGLHFRDTDGYKSFLDKLSNQEYVCSIFYDWLKNK